MIATLLLATTLLAAPAPVKLQNPIPGTCVTSGYGPRNTRGLPRGASRYHKGCDLRGSCGTNIKAAAGGVVTFAGRRGGYGNRVEIRHADGTTTTYSHMQNGSIALKRGMRVAAGQQVGKVGATGLKGMACHLHFEVMRNGQKINPLKFLDISRCGRKRNADARTLNQ